REVAAFVRRMAGEAADRGGGSDQRLGVRLAGLHAPNEALVGVAALATLGVRIRGVAAVAMDRGEVLVACAAHRVLRFLGMARNAGLGQNRSCLVLRKTHDWQQGEHKREHLHEAPPGMATAMARRAEYASSSRPAFGVVGTSSWYRSRVKTSRAVESAKGRVSQGSSTHALK